MSQSPVRVERDGAVARLVLDRPPVNVLDIAAMEALLAAIAAIAADRSVKVMVLTGAGKAFCAGVDVADHTADRVQRMLTVFHDVVRGLLALEVPVVGVVHGAALGGGCELALACDVVLARYDLKMGQPEIKLAVFPPAAAALLPRLVGRQRALDLVLTGRTLSAEEALRLGLVTKVMAADQFEEQTREYIAALAALSGPALRLTKRAVTAGLDASFGEALARAERLYLGELMATADAQEGLAAFLEKRPPVWKEA